MKFVKFQHISSSYHEEDVVLDCKIVNSIILPY